MANALFADGEHSGDAPVDLNRASIFVRVVEEGGFTAAARALSLPKSSVSRAVALLETELGVRLLRRSTRGVSLTEAGTAFYEPVARGLAAVEEAAEAVISLDADMRGKVRITAPSDIGVWLLAPRIATFAERHPQIVVEVILTSRVVDLLQEGVDLAIRAGTLRDESVVARKLPPLEFGIYASPSYLERAGRPRRAADLARHRCILFRAPRGVARWTLTGPSGISVIEVKGAVSTDDFSFALESVAHGAGIALLPTFIAELGGRDRLVRILRSNTVAGADIHLVYPAGRYVPRRVAALTEFLLGSAGRSIRKP